MSATAHRSCASSDFSVTLQVVYAVLRGREGWDVLLPNHSQVLRLVRRLAQYVELHPDGFQTVERLPCMNQMLVMMAQQAKDIFAVSTDLTF